MPADYLFVNATDAVIADITASTATTAAVAARSASAASATSADAAAFVHTAGAVAVLPTAATAAHKKAIAYTLLLSAGVDLGPFLDTAAKLADSEARNKFRIKRGVQEARNISEAVN